MSNNESIGDKIEEKLKNAVVHGLLAILVMMIRPVATLTEVFFRKDMGERYFTAWNLMAGWLLLLVFGAPYDKMIGLSVGGRYDMYGNYQRSSGSADSAWFIAPLVWLAALTFCAYLHEQAVIRRYKEGVRWHSANVGIPRIEDLPYVFEKGIPFLAGILMIWLLQLHGLGALMILSGLVSILLRMHEARLFRERMLDIIDSQIEQDNLAKAVKERLSPEKSEGVQAPLPTYVSDKYREKFAQAIRPAETV